MTDAPARHAGRFDWLPRGLELPEATWQARHRFILATALLHAPALALYGWTQGWSVPAWLGEPMLVAIVAGAAGLPGLSRRLRAGIAGLALVTASAILVQFSGGYIEAHFHYFIVVALVALYEDYVPFLLAVGYVALDHGVIGTVAPEWVYNHPGAAERPWRWAAVHAAAILGESIALMGFWRGSQQVRSEAEHKERLHRQELERLVAHRTAQLTEANRELEAFSYTVSHDLRSPLRTIGGFAGLLRRRHAGALGRDAGELLQHIDDGVQRMGDTIESVLTLSRISRGEAQTEDVDLTAMATEILQELARETPGRQVDWQVEPGLRANGDAGLLRLALENLLGNAWKFTGPTQAPRIQVRLDAARGSLAVQDNGVGFDMAAAGGLFQPFRRLHRAGQFPGTGIGLATVDRIARRHGGSVTAHAAPGEGARFDLALPTLRRVTGQVALRVADPAAAPALAAPLALRQD